MSEIVSVDFSGSTKGLRSIKGKAHFEKDSKSGFFSGVIVNNGQVTHLIMPINEAIKERYGESENHWRRWFETKIGDEPVLIFENRPRGSLEDFIREWLK